jgi:hypothetical protein
MPPLGGITRRLAARGLRSATRLTPLTRSVNLYITKEGEITALFGTGSNNAFVSLEGVEFWGG